MSQLDKLGVAHAGTHAVFFEQGQIFNETAFNSAEELLWAFQAWQQQALAALAAGRNNSQHQHQPSPGVILVHLAAAGLGNRLPNLVTGG